MVRLTAQRFEVTSPFLLFVVVSLLVLRLAQSTKESFLPNQTAADAVLSVRNIAASVGLTESPS